MKSLILLLFLAAALPLAAQERLVPLDRDGSLDTIGRRLERDLQLFPEYSGFREARLFQLPDSTFALEIYYRRQQQLFKQRLLLSPAQTEQMRDRVTSRILALHPLSLQDDSGRSRFLVRTFLLGYGFYSWAIPYGLDLEGRAVQTTGLLTGSAGFLLPFTITEKTPVSQATASLSGHLGTTGIAHGMLFSVLLFGGDSSFRKATLCGTAASLSGLGGGFALARKTGMSAGTAEMIGLGGDYGMLMGLGTAHLLGITDDDHERQTVLATLIGSGLGYWSGSALARRHSYSRGDAELLANTTLLGAYVGTSLIAIADSDESRAFTAAAMTGSGIGLKLGRNLLRDRSFSTGQSRMVLLGTIGGYLLGAATGVLIADEAERVIISLSALGSIGGFWVTYRSFADEARAETAWDLHLSPQALLLRADRPLPLFSLSYRFR